MNVSKIYIFKNNDKSSAVQQNRIQPPNYNSLLLDDDSPRETEARDEAQTRTFVALFQKFLALRLGQLFLRSITCRTRSNKLWFHSPNISTLTCNGYVNRNALMREIIVGKM